MTMTMMMMFFFLTLRSSQETKNTLVALSRERGLGLWGRHPGFSCGPHTPNRIVFDYDDFFIHSCSDGVNEMRHTVQR